MNMKTCFVMIIIAAAAFGCAAEPVTPISAGDGGVMPESDSGMVWEDAEVTEDGNFPEVDAWIPEDGGTPLDSGSVEDSGPEDAGSRASFCHALLEMAGCVPAEDGTYPGDTCNYRNPETEVDETEVSVAVIQRRDGPVPRDVSCRCAMTVCSNPDLDNMFAWYLVAEPVDAGM